MVLASLAHLAWIMVLTVVVCLPLGLSGWALLDAARRPQWAWAMTEHRQVAWMAAIMFGVLLLVVGVAISAWYLLSVRPEIAAAERGDLGDIGAVGS